MKLGAVVRENINDTPFKRECFDGLNRYIVCSFDGNEVAPIRQIMDYDVSSVGEAMRYCEELSEIYDIVFIYDRVNEYISHITRSPKEGEYNHKTINHGLIIEALTPLYNSTDNYCYGFIGYRDDFCEKFPNMTSEIDLKELGIKVIVRKTSGLVVYQILEVII